MQAVVSAVFFYFHSLGNEKNCLSMWKRGLSDEEHTGSCELTDRQMYSRISTCYIYLVLLDRRASTVVSGPDFVQLLWTYFVLRLGCPESGLGVQPATHG